MESEEHPKPAIAPVSGTSDGSPPHITEKRSIPEQPLSSVELKVFVETEPQDSDQSGLKPPPLSDTINPWNDITPLQPVTKDEETQSGITPSIGKPEMAQALPEWHPANFASEAQEDKPEVNKTVDPWSDITRLPPATPKKEEAADALPLSSSSFTKASVSPMLHRGMKRTRSESSLSALSSDFEANSKPPVPPQRAPSKRARVSRTISLAWPLEPAVFGSEDQHTSSFKYDHHMATAEDPPLETVTFPTYEFDEPDADVDMPLVELKAPFVDHDILPPFEADDEEPSRGLTPAESHATSPRAGVTARPTVRIKNEPIDVDDDIILNAINHNSVATNVKLKAKKELEFDEITMQTRFSRVGATVPFEVQGVPELLQNVLFSRACMSWYFGGSPQDMCPTPAKEKFNLPGRGINNFAFIPLHLHPNAPKRPGEHGAMHWGVDGTYRPPDDYIADFLVNHKHLIRVEDKKKPVVNQDDKSQLSGGNMYTVLVGGEKGGFKGKNSRDGWGSGVCFRATYRRRYDRDPMEEEERVWWRLARSDVISFDDWVPEPEWIKEDFCAGKEHLSVDVLKCVGYDESFIRRSAVVMENYVKNPPPPKPKSKPGKSQRKSNAQAGPSKQVSALSNTALVPLLQLATQKSNKNKGKRRAASPAQSDTDRDDDYGGGEDEEDDFGQVYQPRPTKSRS
ncbi:unnamed protein product [Peniophora sp. CBMAI 1063]|nr:unnamed protein product [Peniophora sp. CBMAI 1063]